MFGGSFAIVEDDPWAALLLLPWVCVVARCLGGLLFTGRLRPRSTQQIATSQKLIHWKVRRFRATQSDGLPQAKSKSKSHRSGSHTASKARHGKEPSIELPDLEKGLSMGSKAGSKPRNQSSRGSQGSRGPSGDREQRKSSTQGDLKGEQKATDKEGSRSKSHKSKSKSKSKSKRKDRAPHSHGTDGPHTFTGTHMPQHAPISSERVPQPTSLPNVTRAPRRSRDKSRDQNLESHESIEVPVPLRSKYSVDGSRSTGVVSGGLQSHQYYSNLSNDVGSNLFAMPIGIAAIGAPRRGPGSTPPATIKEEPDLENGDGGGEVGGLDEGDEDGKNDSRRTAAWDYKSLLRTADFESPGSSPANSPVPPTPMSTVSSLGKRKPSVEPPPDPAQEPVSTPLRARVKHMAVSGAPGGGAAGSPGQVVKSPVGGGGLQKLVYASADDILPVADEVVMVSTQEMGHVAKGAEDGGGRGGRGGEYMGTGKQEMRQLAVGHTQASSVPPQRSPKPRSATRHAANISNQPIDEVYEVDSGSSTSPSRHVAPTSRGSLSQHGASLSQRMRDPLDSILTGEQPSGITNHNRAESSFNSLGSQSLDSEMRAGQWMRFPKAVYWPSMGDAREGLERNSTREYMSPAYDQSPASRRMSSEPNSGSLVNSQLLPMAPKLSGSTRRTFSPLSTLSPDTRGNLSTEQVEKSVGPSAGLSFRGLQVGGPGHSLPERGSSGSEISGTPPPHVTPPTVSTGALAPTNMLLTSISRIDDNLVDKFLTMGLESDRESGSIATPGALSAALSGGPVVPTIAPADSPAPSESQALENVDGNGGGVHASRESTPTIGGGLAGVAARQSVWAVTATTTPSSSSAHTPPRNSQPAILSHGVGAANVRTNPAPLQLNMALIKSTVSSDIFTDANSSPPSWTTRYMTTAENNSGVEYSDRQEYSDRHDNPDRHEFSGSNGASGFSAGPELTLSAPKYPPHGSEFPRGGSGGETAELRRTEAPPQPQAPILDSDHDPVVQDSATERRDADVLDDFPNDDPTQATPASPTASRPKLKITHIAAARSQVLSNRPTLTLLQGPRLMRSTSHSSLSSAGLTHRKSDPLTPTGSVHSVHSDSAVRPGPRRRLYKTYSNEIYHCDYHNPLFSNNTNPTLSDVEVGSRASGRGPDAAEKPLVVVELDPLVFGNDGLPPIVETSVENLGSVVGVVEDVGAGQMSPQHVAPTNAAVNTRAVGTNSIPTRVNHDVAPQRAPAAADATRLAPPAQLELQHMAHNTAHVGPTTQRSPLGKGAQDYVADEPPPPVVPAPYLGIPPLDGLDDKMGGKLVDGVGVGINVNPINSGSAARGRPVMYSPSLDGGEGTKGSSSSDATCFRDDLWRRRSSSRGSRGSRDAVPPVEPETGSYLPTSDPPLPHHDKVPMGLPMPIHVEANHPHARARVSHSPPRAADSPPLATHSPPLARYSPPHAADSPPLAVDVPLRGAMSPPRAVETPPLALDSSLRAADSPPLAIGSPPRAYNNPPQAAVSPEYDQYSPQRAPYSPPRGPYSPPRASHSPTRQTTVSPLSTTMTATSKSPAGPSPVPSISRHSPLQSPRNANYSLTAPAGFVFAAKSTSRRTRSKQQHHTHTHQLPQGQYVDPLGGGADRDGAIPSRQSMEQTDVLYNTIWTTKDTMARRHAAIDQASLSFTSTRSSAAPSPLPVSFQMATHMTQMTDMYSERDGAESVGGVSTRRARHVRNRRRRQKYRGVTHQNALLDTLGSHLAQTPSMESQYLILDSQTSQFAHTPQKGELDRLFNTFAETPAAGDAEKQSAGLGLFGWSKQPQPRPVSPPKIARTNAEPKAKEKKPARRWGLGLFRRGGGDKQLANKPAEEFDVPAEGRESLHTDSVATKPETDRDEIVAGPGAQPEVEVPIVSAAHDAPHYYSGIPPPVNTGKESRREQKEAEKNLQLPRGWLSLKGCMIEAGVIAFDHPIDERNPKLPRVVRSPMSEAARRHAQAVADVWELQDGMLPPQPTPQPPIHMPQGLHAAKFPPFHDQLSNVPYIKYRVRVPLSAYPVAPIASYVKPSTGKRAHRPPSRTHSDADTNTHLPFLASKEKVPLQVEELSDDESLYGSVEDAGDAGSTRYASSRGSLSPRRSSRPVPRIPRGGPRGPGGMPPAAPEPPANFLDVAERVKREFERDLTLTFASLGKRSSGISHASKKSLDERSDCYGESLSPPSAYRHLLVDSQQQGFNSLLDTDTLMERKLQTVEEGDGDYALADD